MGDGGNSGNKKSTPHGKFGGNDAASSPSNQQVKDLGRKARASLEQARSKRPEIVRLTGDNVPPPENKKRLPPVQLKQQQSSSYDADRPRNNKRRRSSDARTRVPETQRYGEARQIDPWVPDVSHLPTADSFTKKTQSSVVRLHGLPLGTTANQIRRFFSGLNPQRVVVLLSHPVLLSEWDAMDVARDSDAAKKKHSKKGALGQGGYHCNRHEAGFRVLVKFQSAPAAELAAKRSGEILQFSTSSSSFPRSTPTSADNQKLQGAAIIVTRLHKLAAKYLFKQHQLQLLGLDGEPGNVALKSILSKAEEEVDPVVSKILWTKTIRDLDLSVTTVTVVGGGLFPLYIKIGDPSKLADYTKVAEHRNKLLSEYKRLCVQQIPLASNEMFFHCGDGELCKNDPVVRLTIAATKGLLYEIQHLDDLLLQARRWRLLVRE